MALRLEPDLARLVRRIAAAERRSVNKQLETWVEAAVRGWLRAHPEESERQDDRPPG